MSPDVNQNSAVLHKNEAEGHIRLLHKIYSKDTKPKDVDIPAIPKHNPANVKFKSENEKKPEPITSDYVDHELLTK